MEANTTSLNRLLRHLGMKLYEVRLSRNEKLSIVATAIGMTHPVISKIEHGQYEGLNLKTLQKLAAYYNITLTDLFTK